METLLYKRLQRQASAPSTGYDYFVVGEAARYRADLKLLMERMLTCQEPSRGKLILGLNGNGKTLINKSLQEYATHKNLGPLETRGRAGFDILFSRVSLSHSDFNNIGVELAKSLRRSNLEPVDITYASISAEVLRRFSETYKSPMHIRWLTWPAKIILNWALQRYDNYIKNLVESAAEEAGPTGVDKIFESIDHRLRFLGLIKDFKRFARAQKISRFLEAYVSGDESGYRTIQELNKSLYDDFSRSYGKNQPQEIVSALASIGRAVGCRLIMLQVDDCNDPHAIDFLLPIAESLEDFTEPKILIIASAVIGCWKENIRNEGLDRSALQKLELFFDPIELSSPSQQQLGELARKIENLIQSEEADAGRALRWPEKVRAEAIRRAEGLTYREATKKFIDSAELYLQ